MEGTEEVRREAEERVRKLVEKVEHEAEELARARAEDQLQAESSRIRQQAERREERARRVAEDEIKATANKAKREALAAADETAPAWARSRSSGPPPPATGPSRPSRHPPRHARGSDQGHAEWGAPGARSREEVGIYACGPTVYSRIHIGNARPFVVFSLLARFLRSEGYRAKLVVNVTDINDKIYAAAGRRGSPRRSSRRG